MIKMGSFRSYVGLEEYEMKIPHPIGGGPILQPRFISGELVIAEAHNVLKFTSLAKKKGLSGSLFVTNARLVFVSSDHVCSEDSVPLLSINTLWNYEIPKNSSGSKKTKRKLKLGPSGPGAPALLTSGSIRIHELFVICSNFRTLRVSFKFSPLDHGLKICNALIHHSFPEQIERLFYFDFCKSSDLDWSRSGYYNYNFVPCLDVAGDWLRELKITRTVGFRITGVNEGFGRFETLPEWFVVPAAISDVRLVCLAEKLKGNRPPFWVWGDSRGAAILRMGKLNDESESSAENAFFELLRKTHPDKRPPFIQDLETIISVKEVRSSYYRLIEICCPESDAMCEEIDTKFYSSLEQTKWLHWVSKTIQISLELSDLIKNYGDIIILQENKSRDVSCLVSSVVQIIMDPRFRTVTGFFSLIQKDWIASGHAFHSEYMHSSPVFLLFLDTVYQLLSQNAMDFEFNDRLLSNIWDAVFESTAGTFIFDSPFQRKSLDDRKDFTAWHRILTKEQEIVDHEEKETRFPFPTGSHSRSIMTPSTATLPNIPRTLMNPLYKLKALLYPPTADGYAATQHLICSSSMCDIELWQKLYLSRTAEATPTIGSLNTKVSSPLLVENTSERGTPDSESSTHSPYQTTSFISGSAEQAQVVLGRDPMTELKLVDVLLSALSSSTRYQRNSHGSSIPNRSRTSNFSTVPHHPNSTSIHRRNPFLM